MDWKNFITPQAFERLLDGHATTNNISENRRQNQFHADTARESREGRSRSQELLSPDLLKTSEEWNATQVAAHERLIPFSDNLTTFLFTVASDLSDAQRERLTSFLSLQGVDVIAYTFEKLKTVFVELFCSPKSSMENLSLRVNTRRQHEQNLHRRKFY